MEYLFPMKYQNGLLILRRNSPTLQCIDRPSRHGLRLKNLIGFETSLSKFCLARAFAWNWIFRLFSIKFGLWTGSKKPQDVSKHAETLYVQYLSHRKSGNLEFLRRNLNNFNFHNSIMRMRAKSRPLYSQRKPRWHWNLQPLSKSARRQRKW